MRRVLKDAINTLYMPKGQKDDLLKVIVEEYIKSASPVGSTLVVEKYMPDLSSATVRNYMAELEEKGLICQPHTSAGRIPTIEGYKYYIENFINDSKINSQNKKILDDSVKELKSDHESVKNLAKNLAELSGGAVLVGFSSDDVYYTGISNLFRQPEFLEQGLIYSMSEMIDRLDDVMASVFNETDTVVDILIGKNNPFGEMSSVVLVQCQIGDDVGLIGILGPNRMNYRDNVSLIRYSQQLLSNLK